MALEIAETHEEIIKGVQGVAETIISLQAVDAQRLSSETVTRILLDVENSEKQITLNDLISWFKLEASELSKRRANLKSIKERIEKDVTIVMELDLTGIESRVTHLTKLISLYAGFGFQDKNDEKLGMDCFVVVIDPESIELNRPEIFKLLQNRVQTRKSLSVLDLVSVCFDTLESQVQTTTITSQSLPDNLPQWTGELVPLTDIFSNAGALTPRQIQILFKKMLPIFQGYEEHLLFDGNGGIVIKNPNQVINQLVQLKNSSSFTFNTEN